MIGTGAHAPAFELPDQDGEPVRLSALRGRTVVLYFYPKADTPGPKTRTHTEIRRSATTTLKVRA
jgi:peroxiredoxin Q/BCP